MTRRGVLGSLQGFFLAEASLFMACTFDFRFRTSVSVLEH